MAKHSTLSNPDDLHYAKIKTFEGNPSAIAPDFINQLLMSTDTNIAYRATGVNVGGLTEFSFNNNNSSSIVGIGYPDFSPETEGQSYFDSLNQIHYISADKNGFKWVSTIPDIKVVSFSQEMTNLTNFDLSVSGNFSLFHSYIQPSQIPNSLDLQTLESITGTFEEAFFEQTFNNKGYGLFFFGLNINDPNNVVSYAEIGITLNNSLVFDGSINIIDLNSFSITDGLVKIVNCLSINPSRRSRANIGLDVDVFSVS